jgi:multiple sugar transport system permease protein
LTWEDALALEKGLTTATPLPRRHLSMARREALEGYLFALPWAIGFVLFIAGPMLASLFLSFTRYDIARPPSFIGPQNYVRALTSDPLFWPSMARTFYYALIMIPLAITASLLLALLLNRRLPGTNILRTVYFLPHLTPIVATAVLWKWIFQPEVGLINYALWSVGIEGPGWLGSVEWAIPALIIMALWSAAGGNTMMIFLAGLQGISQELYEAASIDGAGAWARFRHVTLPALSPTIFFNLVLGVIGALKVFTSAFVTTEGGPAYATWFYALHIYQQAFRNFQMGYASALAWIFFILILAITLIQVRTSRRWVYYEGEGR